MAAVSPLDRARSLPPPSDDAATRLYERYAQRVFGYCLRRLRSREEAEDAAQTTFLYALRALRRGIAPACEIAWLLAIARNVCLSRSQATRRRAVEVARDPHLLETAPAPARADWGEPSELAALTTALESLSDQQRRAILLREWRGLSYREIGEELSISSDAVGTLLFRTRIALVDRLRDGDARTQEPAQLRSFLPWVELAHGPALPRSWRRGRSVSHAAGPQKP